MKSKTSLFSKAVFKRNLTGCFGLWAGLFVVSLIFLPVRVYGVLSNVGRYGYVKESLVSNRMSSMIQCIWSDDWLTVLAVFASLVTAMFLFSYLFTARNSNMMHTYPVSRVSLFVTNYVSGLLFLLSPLIVSMPLALLAAAPFGVVTGDIVLSFVIWLGMAVTQFLLFFSMAVCVLMFVGNIIAVVPLYFILNFLYIGIMMTIEWMVGLCSYGVETFSLYSPLGRILSPIYCFLKLGLFDGTKGDGRIIYSSKEAEILFIYLAAFAVFTVISLAAYMKKHIETAGDVITVNWLKPIFRWGAAVCTSSVGAVIVSMILLRQSFTVIMVSVILIGAAVFFIAQMLLERSVHVFKKKRMIECLVYTVCICLVYIGLDADIFGLEKKIPEISEVEVACMTGGIELCAVDSEEIAWVEQIHKQIIDSKKEFEQLQKDQYKSEGTMYSYSYVDIDYRMKDGSRLRRSYWVPEQEDKDSVSGQIEEYAGRPEVMLKRYFGVHYPEIEVYGGHWQDAYDGKNTRVSEADAKKIYKAVQEDIQAGRMNAPENSSGEIIYYGRLDLEVRDEAGFMTTNYQFNGDIVMTEGIAEIYVESQMTSIVKVMKELGYITK